jgi:hypothetical protein
MAALGRLRGRRPARVLTWVANYGPNAEERLTNKDDAADIVLDLTDTPWLEKKVEAAMCHRSQHAMFLRNSKQPTVRDMVRKVETYKEWRVTSD